MPVDPKDAVTFPQLIRAAAAAYGDDLAITLTGDTIPDDADQLPRARPQVGRAGPGLIARGVGKGPRSASSTATARSSRLMLAAIARIGAIAIPISTLIKANELVRVLRQSDVAG